MNTFTFDKNTMILIYGYGKVGKKLYDKLIKEGYKVQGFIDRNAQRIDTNDAYYLLTPEDLNEEFIKYIIVLTFQNMLEQERIVRTLHQKGVNKIIYLNRSNDEAYKNCFEVYNNLVYGETVDDFEFPYTELELNDTNSLYYYEIGESIIVEVPIMIIFNLKKGQQIKIKKHDSWILKERNIVSLYEHSVAYELILNGEIKVFEDFEHYCNIVCGTERTIESFLQDRVLLFDTMFKEYKQKGIAFFRNSPSTAKWNPKGYFNLTDGCHRATFLVNNHNHLIPIKISRGDYNRWCNQKCVQACKKYVDNHKIKNTYTPIIHPAFCDMDSVIENRGRCTASALYKYFGKLDISGYKVLDLYSNLSYYSQTFSRMGVQKIVSVEKRKVLFDFAHLLNELHYINNVDMRNITLFEMDHSELFEIIVLVNDIKLDFNTNNDGKLILKKIDELSLKYFIWSSCLNVESEKKYILENSSFRKYTFLNMELIEGKLVEVGVYEK